MFPFGVVLKRTKQFQERKSAKKLRGNFSNKAEKRIREWKKHKKKEREEKINQEFWEKEMEKFSAAKTEKIHILPYLSLMNQLR